jgi:hypothetical protein
LVILTPAPATTTTGNESKARGITAYRAAVTARATTATDN